MLKFLSGRKRSRNVILMVFIFAMAITLVAFFTAGRGGAAPNADNGSTLAKVGGQQVTVGDFRKRIAYLFPNDQQLLDPSTWAQIHLRGLDKTVRDVLIKDKVIEVEAQRLGLGPTDEEVADRIAQTFSDGNGKFIGVQEYKNRLASRGVAWQDFEKDLRSSIAREKLNNYVTAGLSVSPQEIEDEFKKTETSVNIVYGVIKPSDVRDGIKLSDDELRAYFDGHKDGFKITTDQKKIDYVFINDNELAKSVQVDDAELRHRYDTSDQIDQAHIRQIVLNVPVEKDDATVRDKANDLVTRAKGAASAKPEDFATLAKGNSQDTATASKGGDLGYIKRDRNRSSDVLQRAFSMSVGQISDPIKQNNKYYIIKVEELKKRTFEEAKEGLLASARNQLSYKKGVEVADEAHALLQQNHDLNKTAEEISKKYGAGVATVKSTPYFAKGDNIPDIGANDKFEETVKDLSNKGDIGPKASVPNGFAIPVLADKKAAHPAEFSEVKEKVELAAKIEKSKEAAGKKAQEIAQSAGSPDALKSALEAMKLKAETKDDFKSGTALTGINQSGKVEAVALGLKKGEVSKQAIKIGNDFAVVAATERKDPDMSKLEKDRTTIKDRLLQERKSAIFEAFIDKKQRELEKAGSIKVYDSVLENMSGSQQ